MSTESPRPPRRIVRRAAVFVGLLLTAAIVVQSVGCSSTVANLDPTGQVFPQVTGEALDGTTVTLPDDLTGVATVLLVGYVQNAQFDLDRWILGLTQAETPVKVLEVPTIPGMAPGLFSNQIDGGMRSGIPSEDWGIVVTLYGDDAEQVLARTGNENGRNGRVLLLDADGRVIWFHDRGYSAGKLLELDAAARAAVKIG